MNFATDILENQEIEKWKQFEETKSRKYYISTAGRVKSINKHNDKEYLMKPVKRTDGYYAITVSAIKKTYKVHRLVAEAFIPNPLNKPTVNHIHGVDAGDGIDNLEWATHKEQIEHAFEMGLKTSGTTPMIALDSNGEVIAQHDTTTEALLCYNGRQIHYSKDIQIIGNVILMKQSHYDMLTDNERFEVCYDCFQLMLQYMYMVDNRLVESNVQTAKITNTAPSNNYMQTKDKWKVNINGHDVSRVSSMLNGAIDETYVSDMEMKEYQKFIDFNGQLENDSK